MEPTRIGINGLGRIGRCVLRRVRGDDGIEVVGVNDLAGIDDIAYLIRHDSVHGPYPGPVEADGTTLVLDGVRIPFSERRQPGDLPWGELGADVVVEATGVFRSRHDAAAHLDAGARKVILSAPSDNADTTLVLGVNHESYDPERHHVVSNASCTTNCLAPVLKVLDDAFGIESALFTTVHAYTSSQGLVDAPMRKRRRGRAGALSLVPTTTGAAQATEQVLPSLAGRLDGMAIRVPVPDGSVTDLVARVGRTVDSDALIEVFRREAAGPMQGILSVEDDEVVSVDIIGNPHSAIIDAPSVRVLGGRDVKVLAWYDNEMGYAARLVDLARLIAR